MWRKAQNLCPLCRKDNLKCNPVDTNQTVDKMDPDEIDDENNAKNYGSNAVSNGGKANGTFEIPQAKNKDENNKRKRNV